MPLLLVVIQLELLTAVQAQPGPLVTATVPLPPAAATFCDVGEMANVQPCPWLTVTVRPAIVSVVERAAPPVPATVKRTVPLPLPLCPSVMVTHSALLAAFQGQPVAVDTDAVPVPPPAGMLCASGATS